MRRLLLPRLLNASIITTRHARHDVRLRFFDKCQTNFVQACRVSHHSCELMHEAHIRKNRQYAGVRLLGLRWRRRRRQRLLLLLLLRRLRRRRLLLTGSHIVVVLNGTLVHLYRRSFVFVTALQL